MYTAEQPFARLTYSYDQRAAAIVQGEGLLGPYDIEPTDTRALARAPGYAIFLSAIYAVVGRDFFKVQIVQNLLNSISAVMIFLIAGAVISWRVGVIAGFLAALSHHLSYMSNFILPDSICALPILAAVYLLTQMKQPCRYRYLWFAAIGGLLGLSTWLRPQAMLLSFALTLLLALLSTKRIATLKQAAVMIVASLMAIIPITIRNYRVHGEFVPVNIGVGLNLWEGIADYSGDRFGAVATDQGVAEQEALLYGNPAYAEMWSSPDGVRRDRDRVKKSFEIIAQHPVWYAGVMLKRMRDMTKYSAQAPLVFASESTRAIEPSQIRKEWRDVYPDRPTIAVGQAVSFLRLPVRALQRLTKEAMQLFILFGLLVMLIASPRRALFLLMVPIYYLLFQSLMHTEFRYTLPMQYFLFIFAAIAWVLMGTAIWRAISRLKRIVERREETEKG